MRVEIFLSGSYFTVSADGMWTLFLRLSKNLVYAVASGGPYGGWFDRAFVLEREAVDAA